MTPFFQIQIIYHHHGHYIIRSSEDNVASKKEKDDKTKEQEQGEVGSKWEQETVYIQVKLKTKKTIILGCLVL